MTSEASSRGTIVRRAVLLGVPLLYVVLGLLHPTENPEVGDETGLFITLHFAQLVLIGGLAAVLWLLVDGLESRAATVVRVLIVPFVIVYTAVDAVLGIAWGIVAQKGGELAGSDRAGAAELVETLLFEPEPLGYIFYFGAGLLWLAAVLAVVTAIGRRAPAGALVLMSVGAAIFALGHAPPVGPIGMSLFLAGVAWLELRPRREPAVEVGSLQQA